MVSRPRSDGKRETILAAAIAVLAAEGVQGTTTRKIAAQAGINVGTLHYHFDSKEEVLASVVGHLAGRYRHTLETAFPDPEPLRARIGQLMRFIWSEVQKSPEEQLALFHLSVHMMTAEGAARFPPGDDNPYRLLYRKVLEESSDVRDGSVSADLDALASFLFNGFVGLLLQWLATRATARVETQLGTLIRAAELAFL